MGKRVNEFTFPLLLQSPEGYLCSPPRPPHLLSQTSYIWISSAPEISRFVFSEPMFSIPTWPWMDEGCFNIDCRNTWILNLLDTIKAKCNNSIAQPLLIMVAALYTTHRRYERYRQKVRPHMKLQYRRERLYHPFAMRVLIPNLSPNRQPKVTGPFWIGGKELKWSLTIWVSRGAWVTRDQTRAEQCMIRILEFCSSVEVERLRIRRVKDYLNDKEKCGENKLQ